MDDQKPVTPDRLMQFAWGYAAPLIIDAAVRLRIFDLLDLKPHTVEQVVLETAASRRGLEALLNALVGLELLAREGDVYRLTPESQAFLVTSRPGYRGMFFHHHRDQLLPLWMQLFDVILSGKPATKTNRQEDGAEYFAAFVESLYAGSYPAAEALGRHLEIGRLTTPYSVLDIGAGSGVWGIAIGKQSPHVRIHAVDFARVLEITRKVADAQGLSSRVFTVPGEFMEADFGSGHQLATLGHILHSETAERNRRLIKKTFDALAPGGIIAIQEFIPNDDRTGPAMPLIFAVNMLVNTEGGGTYTFAEVSAWLQEAGFVDPRQLPVPGPSPLVLGTKPD